MGTWKGQTPEELKAACQQLSRAVFNWQCIALALAEDRELLPEDQQRLQNLIAAYQDPD